MLMLFWPLIAKLIATIRSPKGDDHAAQQPVD
jgi:hypothetical protein